MFFTEKELRQAYKEFEDTRIAKAKAIVGVDKEMSPDSFPVWLIKRTNLCPHRLVSEFSYYWLETVNLMDGEFGLTLPDKAGDTPALFFDAVNAVRRARRKARDEDKDKKEK